MIALEFESRLNADKTLTVPQAVATQLAPGQAVRVILLVEDPETEEREWKQMAAEAFLRGYADGDAVYDQLSAG
jgi:hypothetical protein